MLLANNKQQQCSRSNTIDGRSITLAKVCHRQLHDDHTHNNSTTPSIQEDRNPSIDTTRLAERLRVLPRLFHLNQRKVEYRQFGANAYELLRIVEEHGVPVPEQDDHVVIRVEASTVTLEDCSIRRGFDFDIWNPISVPVTPGSDVVGHIIALGSAVQQKQRQQCESLSSCLALHDRVAALVRTGGNARYVSVPYDRLVRLPTNVILDAAEAVAMVSIYTTAYQTLKRIKQRQNSRTIFDAHGKAVKAKEPNNMNVFSLAGNTVLVIGGMNAVGQALLQMCQKAKADKIYATGPLQRHSYLQHVFGAIPLPETGWLEDSNHEIEGKMDFVFDGVNDDIWLDTSYRALKPLTGELVCYGHTAMLREHHMGLLGAPITSHINKLWSHTLPRAQMLEIWESFQQDPETYKVQNILSKLKQLYTHSFLAQKNLKSLFQLLKWKKLKPRIAKRVGLDGVATAQAKLERGEIRGTVVCLPWKS